MDRFVCTPGLDRSLSEQIAKELSVTVPEQLHLDPQNLVRAARVSRRGGWICLPFCHTLCSEGLGADPILSTDGARIRDVPYKRAEELPEKLRTDTPRIRAMCEAVDILTAEGESIVFQVEGPFTLLSSLIPMARMFAALRKPSGTDLLQRAEDWICEYTGIFVSRGIRMISFADTVALSDILGPKMYTSFYIPCCRRLLQRLRGEYPAVPIHLCGKTSQSMMDTDSCTARRWSPKTPCRNYGEALAAWVREGDYSEMPGQYCLNLAEVSRPWLTLLTLSAPEEYSAC